MVDPALPPKWLHPDAAQWWRPLAEELLERGKPGIAQHVLAVYCQLWSQFCKVTDFINLEGQTAEIRGKDGEVEKVTLSPESIQQNKLVALLTKLDQKFGFLDSLDSPADGLERLRTQIQRRLAETCQN
jgi:P27 family predicted phage terminase small subunit